MRHPASIFPSTLTYHRPITHRRYRCGTHSKLQCHRHLKYPTLLDTQWWIEALRPKQNGQHFVDKTVKCILLNEKFYIFIQNSLKCVPGPDSRHDLLAISSDPILWSWLAHRIPQTPITISSSDRENKKTNSLLPIKSFIKSFTGKFRIEIKWLWLNEKRQTDDIYSWRYNGRCGDVIYECRYESIMASSVHAHSVCSQYSTVWTCHIWQVCVCD